VKALSRNQNSTPGLVQTNWEKLLAFGFGVVFIATMLTIALAVPEPTPTQWFVFRVALALAAAGIGAVIPGLIVVRVSTFIRAGGAIALFVIVYYLNPPQLLVSKTPRYRQNTGDSITQQAGPCGVNVAGNNNHTDVACADKTGQKK